MNLDRAIADTRAHLTALQNAVSEAGGPCWTCRFGSKEGGYSSDRTCSHPLVRRGRHNPVNGKVTWDDGRQDDMRSSSGLCGPVGGLWEPAPPGIVILRWLRSHWWLGVPLVLGGYIWFIGWIIHASR